MTLRFYGDPANDSEATEQLYLGLQDTTGAYAEVRYGDNGENMNDIKIVDWTIWDIDLQNFIDDGVNMADIDTVHIGFGDRSNSPLPGGAGVIHIDNIQLYGCICLPELAHATDLTGDCRTDLRDLNELAQVWLQEQIFDLYENAVVNLKDYAVLTNLWLQNVMFMPR